MPFSKVDAALDDIRAGKMVILVDDEDRENEGDLVMAAEACTPADINFMVTHARGLVCLTLSRAQSKRLALTPMVERNNSPYETDFTVSIEAASGVTSGISAADRARTVQVAIAEDATPADIVTPGHIFPIRARKGGVLVRTGHTEGSVDLARLAGRGSAGVICEIMNEDGSMARRPQLERFAQTHGLRILTIEDLIAYRIARDSVMERVVSRDVQTRWGALHLVVFRSRADGLEHLAMVKGQLSDEVVPLVRVDAVELPGDMLDFVLSGGAGLQGTLEAMEEVGAGVVVFLAKRLQPGSLSARVARLGEAPEGEEEPQMDMRAFGTGAQILKEVGVRRFSLMSNHKRRMIGLEGFGLEQVGQVPMPELAPAVQVRKTEES